MQYAYRYRDDQHAAHLAVLCKEGRKFLHIVMLDFPVRLKRIPKSEGRYLTPMQDDAVKTARAMLDAGTRMGITKGARRALEEIVK